jgi:hypothetical protein
VNAVRKENMDVGGFLIQVIFLWCVEGKGAVWITVCEIVKVFVIIIAYRNKRRKKLAILGIKSTSYNQNIVWDVVNLKGH